MSRPEALDIALGVAVRMRRRMLGLSQDDLARACGVTFQQIQKYENGTNRVSFSRLVQIAAALRCSVRQLLDYVDPRVLGESNGPPARPLGESPDSARDLLEAYSRLSQSSQAKLVEFIRTLG
jgi:transcriptional regulator with XRE-family HTH domain